MKKYLVFLISLLIVLAGCSKDQADKVPELLEVSIHIPEDIKVNEEVVLEAIVTQGDEKVEDAYEVKFEIWKTEEGKHEKVKVKHQGKGVYSILKTFEQEGNYSIIAHVTARSMHSMPKKEFKVGASK